VTVRLGRKFSKKKKRRGGKRIFQEKWETSQKKREGGKGIVVVQLGMRKISSRKKVDEITSGKGLIKGVGGREE